MNIDWKKKFTSRKFWLAVIGFVTPLMIAFGASEASATQVASIIMAGGTLIAYIIGEGIVDCTRTEEAPAGSIASEAKRREDEL